MSNFIPFFRLICIALFILLIPFTLSAQISRSGLKNLPDLPPALDRHAVPWLPFEENWSSGLFETNHWNTEQYGNWRIAGQVGSPAPSVEFYYSPVVNNYQKVLTSRLLNARNLIDGDIYLSFDLKTTIVNPTGMEFLKAQVLVDTNWITVWADSNTSSYDWTNKKIKITNPVKGNVFRFRFLAEGQNSLDIFNWLIDNISVYRECAPPLNLTANINFPSIDEALIEWDPPTGSLGNSGWLGWDNGINNDAIGLTDGGTFSAAIRFTPAQLNEYDGNLMTKIRIFPYNSGGLIVLKVWTGGNAAQLELEQTLESYNPGQWNEFMLDNPVALPLDDELWFGYTVTHTAGNHIAGVDNGPAIAGFGDMISIDGSTWESMATMYAMNFNWNIEGYVEYPGNNYNDGNLKPGNSQKAKPGNNRITTDSKKAMNPDRSLLYYQIYKNYELFDTTSATSYITGYIPCYTDCYFIKAVYTDCISINSNEDCIMTVNKNQEKLIEFYPVPASQTLNIKSETELSSLIITNFNYQPVYQTYNLKPGTITINTSTFGNGIYFIRAIDCSGNMHSSKFIVNH